MNWILELESRGFSLEEVCEEDLQDFITVEKLSHHRYVAQHPGFFGPWNEAVLVESFHQKRKTTFFKKVYRQNELAGFLGYDEKPSGIQGVFVRILPPFQGNGIGTLFLNRLKALSRQLGIPVILAVIKTNPAFSLYRRLGFEFFEEQGALYFLRYPAQMKPADGDSRSK
ncbi:MAG: GNAT family N-acetyltransferase [Oscillospiraceae bacterium]